MINHPILLSDEEARQLKQEILPQDSKALSLMGMSIGKFIQQTNAYMQKPLEVPGHGEAGGYEHNKHKENYLFINLAGRLYAITKEEKYKKFTADLLSLYADKYLTFDFHVQKNTNPPGRLFHQILNEHMWLLYASLGYSNIKRDLDESIKKHIEDNLFRPMAEMFTVKYGHDFDRIHNHGLWAVAAVSFCGAVIDEPKYIDMSIYGLKGDSETGGFLAQISKLFSPSGYYLEGPYYHRFAIRPLCLLAEFVHRYKPELDIFNFKGQVIKKTLEALLSTAYPNGVFPALNDASITMGSNDLGVLIAVSSYAHHYGIDENILGFADIQQHVWMHPCGLTLSKAYEKAANIQAPYWPSVELSEGRDGDRGAQAFLRMKAKDGDISQLVMNYGQHGMDHGHFDTLGITFYNKGQEVLREYGFVRWVNVESKFGGRYLPENLAYGRQTVAHNLVAIDEASQNNACVNMAEEKHGEPNFFIVEDNLQAVSAFANEHYADTKMQRTSLMIDDEELESPLLLDIYKLKSDKEHQYDYAIQYTGQIIRKNFDVRTHKNLKPLGKENGYQHLWNVAQGKLSENALISWLQGHSYYTCLMAAVKGDEIIFTQSGANDPSMNLRSENSFILRRKAKDTIFVSALETHGYFNESIEASENACGKLNHIEVISVDGDKTIIKLSAGSFIMEVTIYEKDKRITLSKEAK